MLLVVLVVAGLVSVPLAGGKLLRMVEIRIRWLWALLTAIGLQVLVLGVFAESFETLLAAGHVASYVAAGAFVWANRRIPGLGVIALGGVANLAAIVANSGVMPAHPAALERAGLVDSATRFQNSAVVDDASLWFLGDVFAIPASWPMSNVFSVGDVLILIGVIWFAHRAGGSRLVPRRWRRPEDSAEAVPAPSGPRHRAPSRPRQGRHLA